jgi:predicted flap endonuclease-1-like 5' DNA nuclease
MSRKQAFSAGILHANARMAGDEEHLDRIAAAAARAPTALDQMTQANPFRIHGFSPRNEKCLRKWGIEEPEQLLAMSLDRIRTIPGVGKLAMREIESFVTAAIDAA